jgi:alpha-L-fucosidase
MHSNFRAAWRKRTVQNIRFVSHLVRRLAACGVLICGSHRLLCQVASSAQPTSAEDPKLIDRLWSDASSKYDTQRSAILDQVDRGAAEGPFRADWQSLQIYAAPDWYRDAKFGIFIHWGVYSVPAFGSEWYPHNMYIPSRPEYQHQRDTYGPQDKFGYKNFVPMFRAEHFDATAWAHLFKEAGARYVVPVAEHHDGFAMYDSGLSDWTSVKMGPHRDIVGELAKAVRAEGLHFGCSSHRAEHDFFFGAGREIVSDVNDPRNAEFYGPAHVWLNPAKGQPMDNDFTYVSKAWADDWEARAAEIVQKYHPDIMYFDWWIEQSSIRPALARFAAFYYNESQKYNGYEGVINYKEFAMRDHSGVLDLERGQLSDIREQPWQTDTSISNKSWGYIANDTFKTPEFIVHELVDIVSKNGNLLLNIGPRSDGTIPDEVQQALRDVGSWLQVNGEAIYGSRPWKIFGEGPTKVEMGPMRDTHVGDYTAQDFRFTTKGDVLYAIELATPQNGEAVIHSLAAGVPSSVSIQNVSLLGQNDALEFSQLSDGLHIHLPQNVSGRYAWTFRIVPAKPGTAQNLH